MKDTKNKIYYIDNLRALACLSVVLIHCFTTYLDNATIYEAGIVRSLAWTEILVIVCRWAVPVFFMISGALLLNPGKEISWGKIKSYALRIVAVLLVFGTLFSCIEMLYDTKTFDIFMIPEGVLRVIQGQSWAHLWYLYDLLGIYLILPLLRSFVCVASRRDLEKMLIILAVFTLVIPSVNAALEISINVLLWLNSSVFYVLLGWYLRSYNNPAIGAYAMAVASVLLMAAVTAVGILMFDTYLSWAWGPASPFVASQATAVFLFAKKRLNKPLIFRSFLSLIARLSFAIYVLHPVVTNFLYKAINWENAPLLPGIYELTTFSCVLLTSIGAAIVLKKLPGIGRYL